MFVIVKVGVFKLNHILSCRKKAIIRVVKRIGANLKAFVYILNLDKMCLKNLN